MTIKEANPWLTVKDAAAYLEVSERQMYIWHRELGVGKRFGKKLIRFRHEELDKIGK